MIFKSLLFKGMASQKILATINLTEIDKANTLLQLAESLGIPIASSCGGEGICRKCIVNNNFLSCLTTVAMAIQNPAFHNRQNIEITIDYL